MRAKFITFEGIDGAGKSTHLASAAAVLRERRIPHLLTREPGGTACGEKIRQLLLNPDTKLHRDTETLLLFAARQEHLVQVILPSLNAGTWVICDRFTDATYAYQGAGKGVATSKLAILEQWVHPGVSPDVTLCFDLPSAAAAARIDTSRARDRFELEDANFHKRVRAEYLRRAAEFPGRFHVIDASQSIEHVDLIVRNLISCL